MAERQETDSGPVFSPIAARDALVVRNRGERWNKFCSQMPRTGTLASQKWGLAAAIGGRAAFRTHGRQDF